MIADAAELEIHRNALLGHCYRMLASLDDAEDAVQETMLRAWRRSESFDGRATLRTWLTRIATNVCLDMLRGRKRRVHPTDEGSAGTPGDQLFFEPAEHWLEPIPDTLFSSTVTTPEEELLIREGTRMAFVSALQNLPPKQRATLLLTQLLNWTAAEVAETLETSVAAVNSANQRAKETLARHGFDDTRLPTSPAEVELVDRYVAAFENYDVDALVGLLREDARLSMPPVTLWLQGRDAIRAWMLGPGCGCRGSRLIPTSANGQPAFAQYRPGEPAGPRKAWGLIVLDIEGSEISGITTFLDTALVFPRFGMPLELPVDERDTAKAG